MLHVRPYIYIHIYMYVSQISNLYTLDSVSLANKFKKMSPKLGVEGEEGQINDLLKRLQEETILTYFRQNKMNEYNFGSPFILTRHEEQTILFYLQP